MNLLSALLRLCVLLFAVAHPAGLAAQTKPATASFARPLLGGMMVDWCRVFATDCGQPAADLFCRTQGYAGAASWDSVLVNETIVLGDLQRCVAANACGALIDVVCSGGQSAASGLVPLKLYWHAGRGDNLTAGTPESEAAALGAGYVFIRVEGYAFATEQPGTVPLWSYWGAEREDSMTAAPNIGGPAALAAGYRQVRVEGWVYPTQVAGTVPLNTWWNAQRGDNFLTGTPAGAADAQGSGYGFAWTEGYAFPG